MTAIALPPPSSALLLAEEAASVHPATALVVGVAVAIPFVANELSQSPAIATDTAAALQNYADLRVDYQALNGGESRGAYLAGTLSGQAAADYVERVATLLLQCESFIGAADPRAPALPESMVADLGQMQAEIADRSSAKPQIMPPSGGTTYTFPILTGLLEPRYESPASALPDSSPYTTPLLDSSENQKAGGFEALPGTPWSTAEGAHTAAPDDLLVMSMRSGSANPINEQIEMIDSQIKALETVLAKMQKAVDSGGESNSEKRGDLFDAMVSIQSLLGRYREARSCFVSAGSEFSTAVAKITRKQANDLAQEGRKLTASLKETAGKDPRSASLLRVNDLTNEGLSLLRGLQDLHKSTWKQINTHQEKYGALPKLDK